MNEGQFGVTATRVDVNLIDGSSGGTSRSGAKKNEPTILEAPLGTATDRRSAATPSVGAESGQSGETHTQPKPDEVVETNGETPPVAEAPKDEKARTAEIVDAERKHMGGFIADLLKKKLEDKLSTDEIKLLDSLKIQNNLDAAGLTAVNTLFEKYKSSIDFPPGGHHKDEMGTTPKADYISQQLKYLLEYYYGKKSDAPRSAEDNKNLTNAAESLGLLTGGEDAENSFASIASTLSNGAIAVETFQEKFKSSDKLKNIGEKLILTPDDFLEVQRVMSEIFNSTFNAVREGAFVSGEKDPLAKLTERFNFFKWTEIARSKYEEKMKAKMEERNRLLIKSQEALGHISALGLGKPDSELTKDEIKTRQPFVVEMTRLRVEIDKLTNEITSLQANITMLTNGRESQVKAQEVFGSMATQYSKLSTAEPQQQNAWFNALNLFSGGGTQTTELIQGLGLTDRFVKLDKSGSGVTRREQAVHMGLKIGAGTLAVFAIMTAMQAMSKMQEETAHAG